MSDYAFGGLLIVLCVASFAFLSGPTAVFIGIASAIAGAVLILRGIQSGSQEPDPLQIENDSLDSGVDWDAQYRKDLGR